jgi:aryl-phospho-beta-D-glucosidase BglC (GH1 family)
MKGNTFKKANALVLTFVLTLVLFASNLAISVKAAAADNVIWTGSASQIGDWTSWSAALTLESFDGKSIFATPSDICVKYESNNAPVLVLQSYPADNWWTQVNATYSVNGVAHFAYKTLKETLDYDPSLITRALVYPNGSDITVKEVFSCPAEDLDNPVIPYEGLAGTIVKDMKAGWNLGNSLDSYGDWVYETKEGTPNDFETAWANPTITKELIQQVKEQGFNAIRLPVTWRQFIDDNNGYKVDDAWMDRVEEVTNWILDEGMYCILNVHHDTGTEGWLQATTKNFAAQNKKFEALWKQIATRFNKYDNKLLFEGFNEMLDGYNWSYPGADAGTAINKYNQLFVDTVRATGGNNATRCLVVNTYAACTDAGAIADFIVPTDTAENSLIVEIHYYQPYFYCAKYSEKDQTTVTEWQSGGGKSIVDGTFYSLYKNFTAKGIPVIVGEIAAAAKKNVEDRADYIAYVAQLTDKLGMKIFWWDEGGYFEKDDTLQAHIGMGIINRHTGEIVYPEIFDAIMKNTTRVPAGDITPSETPEPSKTAAPSKTPEPSEAVVPSETPEPSEAVVPSKTPEPSEAVVPSETPEPSEAVVPSKTPEPSKSAADGIVPDITVTSNIAGTIGQNYVIKAPAGKSMDLEKVRIRFNYTKSNKAEQMFSCDCAGISLPAAPYYVDYSSNVKAAFGDGYVDITFAKTMDLANGTLNLQTRMNNSDWSAYSGLVAGSYEIYYDNALVKTIE